MKGVMLVVGMSLGSFSVLRYRGQRECVKNIEQMEWLRDHKLVPPATKEETKVLLEELDKQYHYRNTYFVWPPFPPFPNWYDIPMDQNYMDRFYR